MALGRDSGMHAARAAAELGAKVLLGGGEETVHLDVAVASRHNRIIHRSRRAAIRGPAEDLLSLAGIWSRWESGEDDEYVDTFAVLTTDAAPAIAHLHHRQPMLLEDGGVDVWLDPEAAQDHLLATVQEAADGAYEAWPVSREVNDRRHEGAWLIDRIAA